MKPWRPQAFRRAALSSGRRQEVVDRAIQTADFLRERTPNAPPVFSLKHLSHLTNTEYVNLRRFVRRSEPEPYRVFRIRKRPLPGEEVRFRTIVVPSPWLMVLQRWINANILACIVPHEASVAFSSGNNIREAASIHCGCQWLIKIDIRNFFESITEAQVYRVFEKIGYQPLVAFELSRLCTRVGKRATRAHHRRFLTNKRRHFGIAPYNSSVMGHLPQGAPTSPRIANLVARQLDEELTRIADRYSLKYTRYADDLTFSTNDANLSRSSVRDIIGKVYEGIALNGFTPNTSKTCVAAPGARKLVLGLLVDGPEPRLTKEFKLKLRQHLYYLRREGIGPAGHAMRQGGATTYGLRRHILGLIQHARYIDRAYGEARLFEFKSIKW